MMKKKKMMMKANPKNAGNIKEGYAAANVDLTACRRTIALFPLLCLDVKQPRPEKNEM